MRYPQLKFCFSFKLVIIGCLISTAFLSGCGISSALKETNTKLEDAINSFDRAITALAQESADWRVVMADLEESLAENLQSTIRNEVHNLTRSAILTTSAEFRCNAEYLRLRLRRNLVRIRNSLVEEINQQLAKIPEFHDQIPLMKEEKDEPFICSIVPSAVDLALDKERRSKIDIFGFDFRSRPIRVDLISYGNLIADQTVTTVDFSRVMMNVFETERVAVPERIAEPERIEATVSGPNEIRSDLFVLEKASSRTKKDITNSLSIISDFHAVLDLTESGIELEPNAQEIVLSWNDQIQSEIAILTHQEFLECEVIEEIIEPGQIGFFVPPAVKDNKCKGKPDKEFAGNGPCVRFTIRLLLDPERKNLTAYYWMNAWECPDNFDYYRNDCTESVGSKSIVLFTAQENEKIISFNVNDYMADQYIDKDEQKDTTEFTGTAPVTELQYIGDTDGDDAGIETGVKITFARIRLQIERCEMK